MTNKMLHIWKNFKYKKLKNFISFYYADSAYLLRFILNHLSSSRCLDFFSLELFLPFPHSSFSI